MKTFKPWDLLMLAIIIAVMQRLDLQALQMWDYLIIAASGVWLLAELFKLVKNNR